MKRFVLGIFAAIVLLILFVVLCTFVRRPYERVLIDRFGKLIDPGQKGTLAYNWYFKLPTDSLVRVDTRLHMQPLPFIEYTTQLNEPISVRAFIVWRITDPVKFRQKASGSDEIASKQMRDRVQGLIGQILGKHRLDQLFNSTDEKTDQNIRDIETQIAREATGDLKTPGLNELGIEVADVGFSRMAFPPANTEAVYRRMVSTLSERARTYEAEGQSEANKIRAEGVRKAAEIRAGAIQEAEGIRGKADAEAASIIASVNDNPDARSYYEYWKNMDILRAVLTKNTIMVLSSDDAWLKNLFPNSPAQTASSLQGMINSVQQPGSGTATPAPSAPASPAPEPKK